MPEVQSVENVFAQMQENFRPEKAQGMDATFQFNISGDDGGTWHAIIKDGTCTISTGEVDSPTVMINATSEDWIQVVNGNLNPQMAFMSGKLKIKGDLGLATKLQSLFL